jgi:hypothetical protein
MYGCPNCIYNTLKNREECAVNGVPTLGAVMCDFEFDECIHRKRRCNKGTYRQRR